MSSILTNTGAMTALATLRNINASLGKTQDEISTGKTVASAKDNAAVWAISKVMESDVAGFTAISDSLALGEETVAVARKAAESVTDLLKDMQGKIVASQAESADRAKLQTDIDALKGQIESIVGAAQFNGLNLLANNSTTAGTGSIDVLSSVDRSSTGVTTSDINVGKQDLTTKASSVTGGTYAAGTTAQLATLNAAQTGTLTVVAPTAAGTVYSIGLTATDADSSKFTATNYTTAATTAGAQNIMYISRDGDTAADVAKGLAQAFALHAAENNLDTDVVNVTASGGTLNVASKVTDANDTMVARIDRINAPTAVTIGGGLEAMSSFSVMTDAGAEAALAGIEYMMQTAIGAAAEFGSAQGRIETQQEFISGLTDSLKAGIGTLVDADMEEASARLQALQVQQQLGVQALSIANQAPQSILSLFR